MSDKSVTSKIQLLPLLCKKCWVIYFSQRGKKVQTRLEISESKAKKILANWKNRHGEKNVVRKNDVFYCY